MEKKKKSTKRRSWKKDYLALEKNFSELVFENKNLTQDNEELTETVGNLLNSNDNLSQQIDQLVEEANKLRKDRSTIKTRISQIINKKYFWSGGMSRLKLELRKLL